jgi:predicted transcriptional regulator
MKAIMLSINPKWMAKILNGEKTIEVRKRFPSDYVGWLYIYCTKEKDKHEICIYDNPIEHRIMCSRYHFLDNGEEARIALFNPRYIKGKIVARFWCDKVEKHTDFGCMFPYSKLRYNKATCLSEEEIEDYGFIDGKGFVPLYAIHISQLEIFDKPKELKNFLINSHTVSGIGFKGEEKQFKILKPLKRAPRSWQHIEVDE